MFEYHLYKDALIELEDFNKLKLQNNYFVCLNDALRIVNVKQYSIKQVNDRLIKLNHNQIDIDKVLEYLVKINILNDEIFYQDYVEFKLRQGYGPLYIKNNLYKLGIDKSVEIDSKQAYTILKSKLDKKSKISESKSVFIKKFKTKMLNQGFKLEDINLVIEESNINYNQDALKKDYDKIFKTYQRKYEGYQLSSHIKQKLLRIGYTNNEIEEIMKEVDQDEYN